MDLVYSQLLGAARQADACTGEAGQFAVVLGTCLAGLAFSLLAFDPATAEAFAAWAMAPG